MPEAELTSAFSVSEIKQLWSFLDGAIMNVDTRHHLWKSWALCSRHAWCYVVTEVEIRGGQPFSTAILYEDLIGRAARTVSRITLVSWGMVAARLEPQANCFACDYVEASKGWWRDEETEKQRQRVNTLARTLPLLESHQEIWRQRACPLCLGGSGLICRQHLISGHEPNDRAEFADSLASLKHRLRVFVKSMTADGKHATPEESVSWVEGVCWFTGWGYPVQLVERTGAAG